MGELKPCPFCGSAAAIYTPPIILGDDEADVDWMQAHCTKYCASGTKVRFTNHSRSSENYKAAEAKAIAAWNRRVTP